MSEADYRLYGAPGWGSVLTEAMLVQCGVPFVFEDVEGFDAPGEARQRLLALNPLGQIPTLVLPDGTVMTESAAIALLLAERHPDAGLAPPPDAPERPAFLRLLVWLVANVYPTFTYGDYPERWVMEAPETLGAAMVEQRKTLWLWLESQLGDGPWVLGERFSALDLYVGRWCTGGPAAPGSRNIARSCRAWRGGCRPCRTWHRSGAGTSRRRPEAGSTEFIQHGGGRWAAPVQQSALVT